MNNSQKKTPIEWKIPLTSDETLSVTLETGKCLFIVGANGSGKSALIQNFIDSHREEKFRRISAHRQTWLESGSTNFTPQARKSFELENAHYERQISARWMEHNSGQKQMAVLFDLVAKENYRARRIAGFVDSKKIKEAEEVSSNPRSPFDQINRLLNLGTLAITIEHSKGEEILAKHRDSSEPFGIEKMSDGERNAVILAANVLTVEPGTVLLIDEPERHLHRSIIELFLSALFKKRKDCFFVVSTHEIELPLANPESQVLMLRSCLWKDDKPSAWDAELLEANSGLPEDLKRDILGSRKKILFVEGESQSLDARLYEVLFPDVSVVPKGGCREVIGAVKNLRDSKNLHHVEAFGLIDKDFRSDDEVKELASERIFALEVHSVESLYYCSDAIESVACHQAEILLKDPREMIKSAKDKALDVLKQDKVAKEMAARRSEHSVRHKALEQLHWKSIKENDDSKIEISVDSSYPDELKRFKELVEEGNLDDLFTRYPIRKSGVCGAIADALELKKNRKIYEQTVISLIRKQSKLADSFRKRLQPLFEALNKD